MPAFPQNKKVIKVLVLLVSFFGLIISLSTSESDILGDKEGLYLVTKVTDGDTITVSQDEKTYSVRLIGVDTPETVDPKKEVECFGLEASNKAKELMQNKYVRLIEDPTQLDKDRYGRLLRYVYLTDGTFVNKLMIIQGFAHEYTYQTPYEYQNEFRVAQKTAQEQELGLWGEICN